MELIIYWVAFSVLAAVIAGAKGRSWPVYFLISLLLTPLIGIIVALAMPNRNKTAEEIHTVIGQFESSEQIRVQYLIPDSNDEDLTPEFSKVVGVTAKNRNGMSRQNIIAEQCEDGDSLALVREPENPYDSEAVAVYHIVQGTENAQQIGYISRELAEEIAPRLDAGSPVSACISEITGGGLEYYGVNIEFTKHRLRRNSSKQ